MPEYHYRCHKLSGRRYTSSQGQNTFGHSLVRCVAEEDTTRRIADRISMAILRQVCRYAESTYRVLLPDAIASRALSTAGVSATMAAGSKIAAYNAPPTVPPIIGATQNSQSCAVAQPPTKIAGPVLRAGFTERFVTGIPMR